MTAFPSGMGLKPPRPRREYLQTFDLRFTGRVEYGVVAMLEQPCAAFAMLQSDAFARGTAAEQERQQHRFE